MAKIFREGNLTYFAKEMDMTKDNIYEDLKSEVGTEHSSKRFDFV